MEEDIVSVEEVGSRLQDGEGNQLAIDDRTSREKVYRCRSELRSTSQSV